MPTNEILTVGLLRSRLQLMPDSTPVEFVLKAQDKYAINPVVKRQPIQVDAIDTPAVDIKGGAITITLR